ncbi:hypothetical protein SRB5_15960 [Streptomyces sp. RB5]|uniref:Uncharacterized protein n=1 Tax=Streptomyces smaragdinus TaxID=2585196 RepID=A0A7K0CDD1_9ACTN|nr:hypothetical protein [Streptomyces smaragdinus]MQY11477.1 hypothetical protein [Streptomyces smaragdinus]
MTALCALLAISICAFVILAVIIVTDLREEARDRLTKCSTCGAHHPRHAPHR